MEPKKLTTIEKVIFLKSVNIFDQAAVERLGSVAALTEEIQFSAGETIVDESEPFEAIFFILKGSVSVERNGKRLHEIGEKQAFGTVAALDFGPAVHTVKAIDPVHALKLNARDFHDILSLDFELVQAVFRALCRLIREAESIQPS
jgi:CRP/FNR family cyclic AMP-dependent transcriptional regulator